MAKKPVPKPAPKKKKPAPKGAAPRRNHRPQIADEIEDADEKPMVVSPLTNLDDPVNNPDDIEVDEAAIAQGPTHGGGLETRSQELRVRGSGGRKRSGARTKGAGSDKTKRR
ncbi:MAG TPA: hypothetical protein VFQ65_10530 [Kofleriaceae bacterium]|nr:hypothetical protein [Kofleriaceae bacterium]